MKGVVPWIKNKLYPRLPKGGLVAVVRAESSEEAIKIADACIKGGE